MTESFQELFEESLKSIEMKSGSIVTGTVVDIDKDWITVHAGLKSEGTIPADQFLNDKGEIEVAVGDEVRVSLEAVEDGFGATRLSREKAKRKKIWSTLETYLNNQEVVSGKVCGKVKGGFITTVDGLPCFMPSSQIDIRPLKRIDHLMNTPVKVIAT